MQNGKMNTVRYCSAFISHCANYFFTNENNLLSNVTKAQADNYKCIELALVHFEADEVDMLRNIFISGLPLPDAMRLLNKKGEAGWFLVRKFIKVAASYRGLI